jgi:hypothetical protein
MVFGRRGPQSLVGEFFERNGDAIGELFGRRIGTLAYQGTQTVGLG